MSRTWPVQGHGLLATRAGKPTTMAVVSRWHNDEEARARAQRGATDSAGRTGPFMRHFRPGNKARPHRSIAPDRESREEGWGRMNRINGEYPPRTRVSSGIARTRAGTQFSIHTLPFYMGMDLGTGYEYPVAGLVIRHQRSD